MRTGAKIPMGRQRAQYLQNGVGMREKAFFWRPKVSNEADRVQFKRVQVIPGENINRNGILKGAKAEISLGIALQDELHEAVAKPANAVVENE